MSRRLLLAALLALPLAVSAAPSNAVLVLASAPTRVDVANLEFRKFVRVQNNGATYIACRVGKSDGLTATNAERIQPGDSAVYPVGPKIAVHCIASTSDQTGTGSTAVTEF